MKYTIYHEKIVHEIEADDEEEAVAQWAGEHYGGTGVEELIVVGGGEYFIFQVVSRLEVPDA